MAASMVRTLAGVLGADGRIFTARAAMLPYDRDSLAETIGGLWRFMALVDAQHPPDFLFAARVEARWVEEIRIGALDLPLVDVTERGGEPPTIGRLCLFDPASLQIHVYSRTIYRWCHDQSIDIDVQL
ncbi:hypothetical protein ACFY36_20240 [Actinoplanes sp. NPDC000266]